jgi:hypothetical protein
MVEMRDELMRLLESMTQRVREDALAFDVEIEDFLGGVGGELDGVARRVGLLERRPRPPASGGGRGGTRARSGGASVSRVAPEASGNDDSLVARCFGCLLSLICGQRLAAA